MPWIVKRDSRCPASKPWGVVHSESESLAGMHVDQDSALEQQRALNIEDGERPGQDPLDELRAYDNAMGLPYIIMFDYRSDEGPMLVGTFPSRDAASDYMLTLAAAGFEAEWSVVPISKP